MEQEAQGAYMGMAVLAPVFVVKFWPMKELQLMLSDEVRTREGRFWPLFYKVLASTAASGPLCQALASCKFKEEAMCAGRGARL